MIKRPTSVEDEEDILRMQEEYLTEKFKNKNLKPAAQVINLRRTEPTNRVKTNDTITRKLSKYAKAKGLKNNMDILDRTESTTSPVIGHILEKNLVENPQETLPECEDDKVYYPQVIKSLLGNIIEKYENDYVHLNSIAMPSEGFPAVTKQDSSVRDDNRMDIDAPSCSNIKNQESCENINLPTKSYMISSKEAHDIHNENIKKLKLMTDNEIFNEQKNLLRSLDPKLIKFIKGKRQHVEKLYINKSQLKVDDKNRKKNLLHTSNNNIFNNNSWDSDILSHPEVGKWLHFDSLEKDKLEWIKGIEVSKDILPDEPYEARFDFNGYLLPYTMEYTEENKTLFHHGEEPHRPGYTLAELIELSRSTVTQQRVMALNTIAGFLEYYSAGTYRGIIDVPLSKIFFIVRIAMDENKVTILEPALKAMRNLLYNKIDEASLDALLGLEEGSFQPCLENDKSEKEVLELNENDLKDFHLAEIDLISALLRTNILQRIYYILHTIKPSFNSVHYALQILIRLARDSVGTASEIIQTQHLMNTIIENFVPVTGINFIFDPQIIYNGKPFLAAVKLLRILSLQSAEVGDILLTQYDIMKPISEYISSGVDSTYGLRIQIEAYCLLSNMLHYGLAIQNTISLCGMLITSLYKHVKGTDIFVDTSTTTAHHAAVVLQLINKLLNRNLSCIDDNKSKIYPLLKEGAQKWIAQLSSVQNYTCGHLRLLCAVLDCCKSILEIEKLPMKFLNDSLKKMCISPSFNEIVKHLVPCSNLLSGFEHKDLHLAQNLISLGGCMIDSTEKIVPILSVASPLPFLSSLCNLLLHTHDKELLESFLNHLVIYFNKLANCSPSLCDNWFTRIETGFVFNALQLSAKANTTEENKDILLKIANKLCYILRVDKKYELEFLFDQIVFNKDWFTAERLMNLINLTDTDSFSKALTAIDVIKTCYSRVITVNYKDTGPNIILSKWREPILPRDWIYLPILILYSKSQAAETASTLVGEHAKKVMAQIATDKELIVSCSLEWILFNELYFQDLLNDINVTDRFCRIMCVFMCDNSLFLDAKIKILLLRCLQILFQQNLSFNFDKQLTGLNNFQDFYTQFLEQFQSVSYGDHAFAACVLVPLAQRHNVKWRKLLWSEYAGCLRALDCPEELLCYELKDYLHPEENDESLIKCYFRALSNNLLRRDTIAYKIAFHHAEHFKKRTCPTIT